jgi:Fe2+ transport system protein FeoA
MGGMSYLDIQCPMCGQQYASQDHLGCKSCPINKDCSLVCCPACGYQTINARRSKFARIVQSLLPNGPERDHAGPNQEGITLADVPAGCKARVQEFTADLPLDRCAYLQAYGLVPGYWVQVLQHSPVTIIRLDHLELALENDIARNIKMHQHSIIKEI